jgi:dihydropteroate synthase
MRGRYRSRIVLPAVKARRWKLADRVLELSEPAAAGIVNVTGDSMFSGARSGTPARAVEDGRELAAAGFDMLDVGAVAARSGPPVSPEREGAALVPAIEGLAGFGVPVSADTFSPVVARRALAAGAVAVNDIGGGSDEMFELIGETGCGYALMHIEGPPRADRAPPRYEDPIGHLAAWFGERLEAAAARGVAREQVAIDPGLDFDLSVDDDLEVLRRLGELQELGCPLYLSLSRKDFLGAVLAGSWEGRLAAEEREWATVAATSLAVAGGALILRLHDRSSLQALRVAGRIARADGD